jgi:hypothetical protein
MYASLASPRTPAHMLPMDSPSTWQPFMSHRQSWTESLLSRKMNSRPHPQHAGWPICGSPSSFSPTLNQWSSGESQSSIGSRLLGLLGPYHQYAIGTFNTCSRGPIHRSLIDTGGGYNLEGTGFSHTTHWPSQVAVSTFYLRDPPDLQFNHASSTKPNCKFKEFMAAPWSSDHSAIYCGLHLCLTIAKDLSLALEFTKIDKKVVLMQLGYQSNSYNLMHKQES